MKNLPPGWLNGADIAELQRLASGKTVLEMGAYKGRSTVVLSKVAKYVVSVDRHQGVEGHGKSLADYLVNVRPLENVAIVVASFADFVPLLDCGINLVFIDGDHDYDSVQRDMLLALCVDPAVVAFHDWDLDDVRRAATEMFGEPDSVGGSVASFVRHR